jgi:beta-glucosidase/6-phospho-beta-glucosidase/beta-galactosidase
MRQSFQLVREMGATTIVEFFPWAYFEPRKGQYNWGQADRIVRHAENQGVRIIARMGLVPAWARPEETTFNYIPEESFDDFANFVAAFAARYAGTINHIIIWNEPNLAFEWGYQDIDPSRYVRMLQAVYGPAHKANPDVVVLAGALAPTLEPSGSPYGLNDLLYLEAMYEAGAAAYFDALAIHTYGLTQPPDVSPSEEQLNFRRAELLYAVMQRYDETHKPVTITESGWNDNTRWVNGVRPSQRVTYTLAAYEWTDEHWPWLDNLCMWIFRYPRLHHTHRDNFTFVNPDFQPKSIYFAVQAYARGWETEGALWLPPPSKE